jgi:hypothetical protein
VWLRRSPRPVLRLYRAWNVQRAPVLRRQAVGIGTPAAQPGASLRRLDPTPYGRIGALDWSNRLRRACALRRPVFSPMSRVMTTMSLRLNRSSAPLARKRPAHRLVAGLVAAGVFSVVIAGCSTSENASPTTTTRTATATKAAEAVVGTEPAVTRPWPTGCLHGHVSVVVQRVESFLCVEVGTKVSITFEGPKTAGPWVPWQTGITAGSGMAASWPGGGTLLIDHATAVAPGYSAAFSSYYRHNPKPCPRFCPAPASVRIRVSFNVVPAKHHSATSTR